MIRQTGLSYISRFNRFICRVDRVYFYALFEVYNINEIQAVLFELEIFPILVHADNDELVLVLANVLFLALRSTRHAVTSCVQLSMPSLLCGSTKFLAKIVQ